MGQSNAAARVPQPPHSDGLTVRPAASRQELEDAYSLVYTSYRRRGYLPEHPEQIRLTVFNAFPTTTTFVAVLRQEVIATASLVLDTPVGLPMDEIYHDELEPLRQRGRKLTEATMLADRRRQLRRALPMLMQLMKRVFDQATLMLDADDMCISINPRHETYYERYLLFEPLGELRMYPSVCDNPALAKRLNLNTVRQRCEGNEKLLRQFFTNRTPLDMLHDAYRLTVADLHYFFEERTDIFRQVSWPFIEALRRARPDYPWDDVERD